MSPLEVSVTVGLVTAVFLLALLVCGFAVAGTLTRIAAAVELQNRHYGIGQEDTAE